MAIKPQVERLLRATLFLSLLPALGLLIPAGLHMVAPLLGFIGVAFSVGTSLIYLVHDRRVSRSPLPSVAMREEGGKAWGRINILVWSMDLLAIVAYFSVLVPIWVRLPYYWSRYGGSGDIMLITYSTVPLMGNMIIHFFLFAANSPTAFRTIVSWYNSNGLWLIDGNECPHCHQEIKGVSKGKMPAVGGQGYSLLRGEEYDEDASRRISEDTAGKASEETAVPNVLDV